eukprot:365750-Chlamydomonas_euryale.AAC.13
MLLSRAAHGVAAVRGAVFGRRRSCGSLTHAPACVQVHAPAATVAAATLAFTRSRYGGWCAGVPLSLSLSLSLSSSRCLLLLKPFFQHARWKQTARRVSPSRMGCSPALVLLVGARERERAGQEEGAGTGRPRAWPPGMPLSEPFEGVKRQVCTPVKFNHPLAPGGPPLVEGHVTDPEDNGARIFCAPYPAVELLNQSGWRRERTRNPKGNGGVWAEDAIRTALSTQPYRDPPWVSSPGPGAARSGEFQRDSPIHSSSRQALRPCSHLHARLAHPRRPVALIYWACALPQCRSSSASKSRTCLEACTPCMQPVSR